MTIHCRNISIGKIGKSYKKGIFVKHDLIAIWEQLLSAFILQVQTVQKHSPAYLMDVYTVIIWLVTV